MKKYIFIVGSFLVSLLAFAGNPFEEDWKKALPEIQARYDSFKVILPKFYSPERVGPALSSVVFEKIVFWVDKYSWAIPNDEAIQTIKKYGPIIELGAGGGYWAHLLDEAGVDIVAFDNWSWYNLYYMPKNWFKVEGGDATALLKHPDRTLFLCWPPKDKNESAPFASGALELYSGTHVIYVGEDKGGETGDTKFFELLERDFEVEETVAIPNWPIFSDKLTVFKRKTSPMVPAGPSSSSSVPDLP